MRDPAEFRRVYGRGERYNGRFMTAFVLPNDSEHQRLGVTASRKTSVRAIERNRMKRLLRESFRLSEATLAGLQTNYDWVLNARRSLLTVKSVEPMEEFQRIVARVASDEQLISIRSEHQEQ
ncbi:MAG: ribonuclease P protein component [Pyrinomonadaceae bacterium]